MARDLPADGGGNPARVADVEGAEHVDHRLRRVPDRAAIRQPPTSMHRPGR
jgi:hypothetical protein